MLQKNLQPRISRYWSQICRFVVHHSLHADDPPHRLALGVAIGLFVTFTPTVGFQMAVVVFLAWLLGANKAVGLPVVWLSNPAIYYACFVVGRFMIGAGKVEGYRWARLSDSTAGWWPKVSFYWSQLIDIAAPLWLGSLVLGLPTAIVGYYLVYSLVRAHRLKRWGQLAPPQELTG